MVVTEKFTALVMQTRCKGLQMLGDCGCFGSPACNQAAAKNETQADSFGGDFGFLRVVGNLYQ